MSLQIESFFSLLFPVITADFASLVSLCAVVVIDYVSLFFTLILGESSLLDDSLPPMWIWIRGSSQLFA